MQAGRSSVAPLAFFVVVLSGCPNQITELCGLSTAAPGVEEGRGSAQLDGADFAEESTWAPGSAADVLVGTLDMIIPKDQTGSDFDQLVEDGVFPFCVTVGERSDSVGQGIFVDKVTNAEAGGNVVILGLDGDILSGRFEFDVADPDSGETSSFTDGQFNARRR